MTIEPNQTLDALVAHIPAAIPVLDSFGIDYCCDRHQSLEAASRAAGISFEEITRCLVRAEHIDYSPVTKWMDSPLSDLMNHIVDTHHVYCRQTLGLIGPLLNEVCQKHGKQHPELQGIGSSFSTLNSGIVMHLLKEEQTLFPMIARIEEARMRRQPLPRLPFGTIRNPITMMGYEHDEASRPLRQIRQASHNYQAPADTDSVYSEVLRLLKALEQDTHQHVYLEDYVLFPRAIALEQAAT